MKVVTIRKQIYDPSLERYVNEEIPTHTIKRARRLRTASANTVLASHYISSGSPAITAGTYGYGSVARVIRFMYGASKEIEMYVKDRSGTIDFLYLPSAGRELYIGGPYEPVYTAEGTLKVCFMGTQSAGTYICSFELIKRSQRLR